MPALSGVANTFNFGMFQKNKNAKRELIAKILRQGHSLRGQNISLKYIIDSEYSSSFVFIVSAKIIKSAVSRNKIKRRGRVIISKLLPRVKKDYSALIFFEKGSLEMKFSELEIEITKLLQKAGVLN